MHRCGETEKEQKRVQEYITGKMEHMKQEGSTKADRH